VLKVGAGDYSPPCKAPPCCLKVDCGEMVPLSLGKFVVLKTVVGRIGKIMITRAACCTGSCVPVGRAAWILILVFSLGVCLYVGGGVGHAVKIQGRDLGEGVALLPHLAFWKEVRGLVEDGVRLPNLQPCLHPNDR
jgi:hypothetical protein